MLTTLALINTLFTNPQWQLYRSVFPANADDAVVAMVGGRPPFSDCVQAAVAVCTPGGVCHLCFVQNTDGTTVCSFVCGQPGEVDGCPPPAPCPRPNTELSTDPPASVNQED